MPIAGLQFGGTYRVVVGDSDEIQLKRSDEVVDTVHFLRDASGDRIVSTTGLNWLDSGFGEGTELLIETGFSDLNDNTVLTPYVVAGIENGGPDFPGTNNVLVLVEANTLTATYYDNAQADWALVGAQGGGVNRYTVTLDAGVWDVDAANGDTISVSGANSGSFTIVDISGSVMTLDILGSTTAGNNRVNDFDFGAVTNQFDSKVIELDPSKSAVTTIVTISDPGGDYYRIERTDGESWDNSVFVPGGTLSISGLADSIVDNTDSFTIHSVGSVAQDIIELVKEDGKSIDAGTGLARLNMSRPVDTVVIVDLDDPDRDITGNVLFERDGLGDKMILTAGTWAGKGLEEGFQIQVTGSGENNGTYEIKSISGATLRVEDTNTFLDTRITDSITFTQAADETETDRITRAGGWADTAFGVGSTIEVTGTADFNGEYTVIEVDGNDLVLATRTFTTSGTDGSTTIEKAALDEIILTQKGHNTGADTHQLVLESDGPIKTNGGTLEIERSYYVEVAGNDITFYTGKTGGGTLTGKVDLASQSGLGSAQHSFERVVDLAPTAGNNHILRIDITDNGTPTGNHKVLGPGGSDLSSELTISGNGQSLAKAKGSGGGFVGANVNDARIDQHTETRAVLDAAIVEAGGSVSVKTDIETDGKANVRNGTGGFVGIGDADARSNQTTVAEATIGDNVRLRAGGDLLVDAGTNLRSDLFSRSKAGGFVGLADATARTNIDYDIDIGVGASSDIIVLGDVRIAADVSADIDSKARANGLGVGGDARSMNDVNVVDATVDAVIGSTATIEAKTVAIDISTPSIDINADGSAKGAGFYSEGEDDTDVDYTAHHRIDVKNDVEITGFEGVDFVATFGDPDTDGDGDPDDDEDKEVYLRARSFARSTGLFGWVSADANITSQLDATVASGTDALITAGPRADDDTPLRTDVESSQLAFLILAGGEDPHTERDPDVSKRSLASGGRHGDTDTARSENVDIESDVLILSGKIPVLEVSGVIDTQGNIVEATNINIIDDEGLKNEAGQQIKSADSEINVQDIVNPGSGDVVIRAKDSITGTEEKFWEWRDSLPQVRITNYSDLDLVLQDINVLGERAPLAFLDPDTGTRNLVFNIVRDVAPSLVTIENYGPGDVRLTGIVENPIGTTSIYNEGGDILAEGGRAGSLIRTNILRLETDNLSNGPYDPGVGTIGESGARINIDIVDADDLPRATEFESRSVFLADDSITLSFENTFFTGQLVTYEAGSTALGGLTSGENYYVILSDDGVSIQLASSKENALNGTPITITSAGADTNTHTLTPVTRFNVDSAEDIYLDVKGRHRSETPQDNGGGDDNPNYMVTIDAVQAVGDVNMILQTSVRETHVGERGGVTVKHPAEPTGGGNNPYILFFEPDGAPIPLKYIGAYADTPSKIESLYSFRDVNQATSELSEPGVVAGGNIVIKAAEAQNEPEPRTNILGITEILNTGDLDVWTNGYVTLTEKTGDMRVERIRSEFDDVLLYSPRAIIDARNGTEEAGGSNPEADVSAVNITMVSGADLVVGTGPYFLLPDAEDVTAGTTVEQDFGGVGKRQAWLEINVDRKGDEVGMLRVFDTTSTESGGVWLDETTGDMRIHTIDMKDADTSDGVNPGDADSDDVGLRSQAGSIIDGRDDLVWNVRAQSIYIDAHGGSIGQFGNDLDIDSRYNILPGSIDDVALEASNSIYLTETTDELHLVYAHTYTGDIRLTVREDGAPGGTDEGSADFILKASGIAQFAQDATAFPNEHIDNARVFDNGTIFAEKGSVQVRAGDDISLDPNSRTLAEEGIEFYGDARVVNEGEFLADTDAGFGADIVIRGELIAGADVTYGGDVKGGDEQGTAVRTETAPVHLLEIFGNTDEDVIDFGDAGGIFGTTTLGSAGYVLLGSKTRAYGSQERPVYDGQAFNTTGDDGEDLFRVYYLQDTLTRTSPETISVVAEHTLTLDGQADTDTYEIYTLGSNGPDTRNYIVNVLDTGDEDNGVDEMTIFGFDSEDNGVDVDGDSFPTDDIFLMRAAAYLPSEQVSPLPVVEDTADRPGYVAILHGTLAPYEDIIPGNEDSDEVQRINYDTGLNGRLTIEGQGGNDAFFSDDVTVIATYDGGAGDDTFQIGQIFGSNRNIAEGNLLAEDEFPDLVATTRGWLSRGSSAPLVAQGGTGNDTFRVYSNQSELRLEGDDNNDLFIVRAFAIAATTDFNWDFSVDGTTVGADPLTTVPNVDDLDAGRAVLTYLYDYVEGPDFKFGTGDDLNSEAAIDSLTEELLVDFGVQVTGTSEVDAYKQALKDNLPNPAASTYIFDTNNDGGINYLDLYVTQGDTTDDTIVLDEEGVASPQIGLGYSVAQAPDIRAGGGQDEVRYNINAPVSVDGGTGFDKLVILATEFADDIAITKDGIYGAGLNVRYDNVEVVEVDGLEGDDKFYVQSTAFGVAYRVIGGLGSDIINVAGDIQEDIITRELEGVSGAADHLVSSDDILYDGLVVDGLDYNVTTDGQGLVVIDEGTDGFTAVREGATGGLSVDSYQVYLGRKLTAGEVVYVTVSAARSPQEERDDTFSNPTGLDNGEADTMWVSTTYPDGTTHGNADLLGVDYLEMGTEADESFLREVTIEGDTFYVPNRAAVLRFDDTNWNTPRDVFLWAVDDARSEGDRVVVVQHSVISQTSNDYDAIDVRNVEVELRDNDTPGVLVTEVDPDSVTFDTDGNVTGYLEDGRTLIVEGDTTTGLSDIVLVQLAKEVDSGQVVVKINLGDLTGDPELMDLTDKAFTLEDVGGGGRFDPLTNTITFDNTSARNWDKPVAIKIVQVDDFVREDPQTAVLSFGQNLSEFEGLKVDTWDDAGTDKIKLTLAQGGWVAGGVEAGEAITITGITGLGSATIVGFEDAGLTALLDVTSTGVSLGEFNTATALRDAPVGPLTTADYPFPNLRSGTGLLDVEVIDNDTPGSVVLESGRDTVLVPQVTKAGIFDFDATAETITAEAGYNWFTAGFDVNDTIEIEGFDGWSNGTFTIASVSGNVLTVNENLTDDGTDAYARIFIDGTSKSDTYKLRLTDEPTADVTVAILTDGLADVTAIDRNGDGDFTDAGEQVVASDYQTIGGLRPVQLFSGSIIFDDNSTNATLTRGTGDDLGSFVGEGWQAGDLIRVVARDEVFSDALIFGDDGTNLTVKRASGDFNDDGFEVGQTILVSATETDGFDDNNGEYEIGDISGDGLTITLTSTATPWTTTGESTDDTGLSIVFDGEFEIAPDTITQEFNDMLTFADDGTNLTVTQIGAGFDTLFEEGDSVIIAATSTGGFDLNNGEYIVAGVSGDTITLATEGEWTTSGTPTDNVVLSLRDPSVTNSTLVLKQGSVFVLPNATPYEIMDNVILSKLVETEIWSGDIFYEQDEDGADRLVRLEAFVDTTGLDVNDPEVLEGLESDPNYDVQGFLGEGFVEGMRVRISEVGTPTNYVDAKIAIIRGFNGSKDHTMQFTFETNDAIAAATWLTGATEGSPVQVEINRIAVQATFSPDVNDTPDAGDYYRFQTIELTADPYYEVPTTREGVKIFPVKAHRLSDIRGPLAVEGGVTGADRSLTNGVKLPGEWDEFLIAIGTQAPESQQIDVLNIFNDGSWADTTGTLTETTLSGFGMGPDLVFPFVEGPLFGEGAEDQGPVTLTYPGGISFGKVNFGSNGVSNDSQVSTVEVVNVMLGVGNDSLDVEGTLNPAPHVSAENNFEFIDDWDSFTSASGADFVFDGTDYAFLVSEYAANPDLPDIGDKLLSG